MRHFALLVAFVFVVAACGGAEEPAPTTVPTTDGGPAATAPPTTAPTGPAGTEPAPPTVLGDDGLATTLHRGDGNRAVPGHGALPSVEPRDVPLRGDPVWVVGVAAAGGPAWLVAYADGSSSWVGTDGAVEDVDAGLALGQPPAVAGDTGAVLTEGSPLTHPVVLPPGGLALVDERGVLRVRRADESAAAAAPLPDARLLTDDAGRVLFLSGPTDRYRHGVLGDVLEAGSVTLLDAGGAEQTFPIPDELVVEGLSPIWTDLDGDGEREIVVTLSDAAGGARLAVFAEDGSLRATGPAVGQGNRWRHQIAAAPLGPKGELELAAVLTPHIGGVVEFYRLEGDRLEIVAAVPGFTSHVLGSRNLDLALAADADGDGRVEVVVPSQDRTSLGGIRRTTDGAEVAWTVPLAGRLATNLAAVAMPDGTTWFAAGRADGVLRIWPGS